MCVKKDILNYMEEKHGPITEDLLRRLGLPLDKYDAALMAKKVMYASKTEVEKAVLKALLSTSTE